MTQTNGVWKGIDGIGGVEWFASYLGTKRVVQSVRDSHTRNESGLFSFIRNSIHSLAG